MPRNITLPCGRCWSARRATNTDLDLWENWLQEVSKDWRRARAYLRGMLQKTGIDKKISPHKSRHTYIERRGGVGGYPGADGACDPQHHPD